MIRAIYPGSFDPVTYGHMDIIIRASALADELIVGVLSNNAKTPLFSAEERVKMLEEATGNLSNVKVVPFERFCGKDGRRDGHKGSEGHHRF